MTKVNIFSLFALREWKHEVINGIEDEMNIIIVAKWDDKTP